MSTRKIKIKVKAEKENDVRSALGLTVNREEIKTIYVEVPESKQLYEVLSTNQDILDWDFSPEQPSGARVLPGMEKHFDPDYEMGSGVVEDLNEDEVMVWDYVVDFNTLATYIEAVWRLSKKSQAIKYGSKFFNESLSPIYEEVANEPTSIQHMSLKTVLELYYQDSFSTALYNTKEIMESKWKSFSSHPTLISLANFLYRSKN